MNQHFQPARTGKIRMSRRAIELAIEDHRPGKKDRIWFLDQPGLYLQITPNGCASYCLRYDKPDGTNTDYTIGQVSKITPEMAREAAQRVIAGLTLTNTDPMEARRTARREAQIAAARTFQSLSADFMASAEVKALAIRTTEHWQWLLDKYLLPKLGKRPAHLLKKSDVKACIRAIQIEAQREGDAGEGRSGFRTANMAQGLARRMFNWAMDEDEDRYKANPATFRKLFNDAPAKRIGVLNDERVRFIWAALEAEAAAGWGEQSVIALQLAFVTLQRPNELTNARRQDFDWENNLWRIPESLTKTNDYYEIPLSDLAASLFKKAFAQSNSRWAFPAKDSEGSIRPTVLSHRFAKTRERLVEKGHSDLAKVQLYDARRFGRTCLEQRLGFPEHIAERVINHAEKGGMSRRYNVGDYSDQVREAHHRWSAELSRIAQVPTGGGQS